jgi:hypothetical protein
MIVPHSVIPTTRPMKKRILSLLLAILPLALLGASGTAIPGGNQSAPFVITKPGAYYLAGNRVMTTKGDAIIKVAASEVTLDLNGYSLSYPDINGTGVGISVVGANCEIRNGSITTTPSYGIYAEAVTSNLATRVIDVRVADTTGIYTRGHSAWIERCHVTDTRGDAINLGHGGTAKDCVIRNVVKNNEPLSGHGVTTDSNCTVIGCIIDFTERAGIFCDTYCVVKNNRISAANVSRDPSSAGINVLWGHFSTISGNTITMAFAAGIRVSQQALFTTIERNVIGDIREAGTQVGYAIVSLSPFTVVRDNTGCGNEAKLVSGAYTDGGGNVGG